MIQDKESNSIWIGQETYARELIKKFKMEESNAVSTPIQLGSNLVKAVEEDEMFDQEIYQSVVGSLLYLYTRTRPGISYAVSSVARFTSKPTKHHWMAVKRIFRYLNGTPEFCKSGDMVADMLTKGLNFYQFAKLREMAGLKKKQNSE
eukprot:gene1116-467_t